LNAARIAAAGSDGPGVALAAPFPPWWHGGVARRRQRDCARGQAPQFGAFALAAERDGTERGSALLTTMATAWQSTGVSAAAVARRRGARGTATASKQWEQRPWLGAPPVAAFCRVRVRWSSALRRAAAHPAQWQG